MITGIHHVSFEVSDMERPCVFMAKGSASRSSTTGPSAAGRRKPSPAWPAPICGWSTCAARAGAGIDPLLRPGGRRPRAAVLRYGQRHLCFLVDDIDAEMQRLTGLGARFLSEAMTVEGGPNAGNRYVYFFDPDDIPMELSQPVKK